MLVDAASNMKPNAASHSSQASRSAAFSQGGEMKDKLTSVVEASQCLGVSTFTTRRLIKSKQLRAVRVGKRILVPASEIERVMEHGCGRHSEHG
jgi:excisionase family DNA binding protein